VVRVSAADRLSRSQVVLGTVATVVGVAGLLYPAGELFLASDDDLPWGNLLSFDTWGAVLYALGGVAAILAARSRRPPLVLAVAACWMALGLYTLFVSEPDDNVLGVQRLGGFSFGLMMAVGLGLTGWLSMPRPAPAPQ
jgi:hypothetical protein